ncbi:MAG: LptA/OstA family protein [Desulfomonilia bacterium]|nr:LptA/OstA family protein [Desulfomonilia bacterium]
MIEIESDRLEVNTLTGEAVFEGNVRAKKDAITLSSSLLRVRYNPETSTLSSLVATGEVSIAWEDKEASCTEVTYDLESATMVLSGDVLITRGPEQISGQKVIVDMASNRQIVEGQGGRVKIRVNTEHESGILKWEN